MPSKLYENLKDKLYNWVIYEPPASGHMPYDFDRLKHEIRLGDVLLIEGRSRISTVIRTITQSTWTHAALYVGRMNDYDEDNPDRAILRKHTNIKESRRLIIEDMLDRGTVVTPLSHYRHHHIRICRPIGITHADIQLVLNYAIRSLGQPYNVRQLLDLARFLLPWSLLPRRWGSSLFRTSSGKPESGICSSLIAEAFASVQFPILPYIKPNEESKVEAYERNPYLFSPKDFDFSPYFEIIKYPLFSPEEPLPYYRRFPWNKDGRLHHDHGIITAPKIKKEHKIAQDKEETNQPKLSDQDKEP